MEKDFLDDLFDKDKIKGLGDSPLDDMFNPNPNFPNIGDFGIPQIGDPANKLNYGFVPIKTPADEVPGKVDRLARVNDTTREDLSKIKMVLEAAYKNSRQHGINNQPDPNDAVANQSITAIFNALEKVNDILRRKVLFIGAENKNKSKIGVNGEFTFLKALSKNKKIGLRRATPPTIKQIFNVWDAYRPSIVFFSCHGEETSLYLQDEKGNSISVPALTLKEFFEDRSSYTECVILSACHSRKIGKSLKDSCKNVVAISEAVSIDTARAFTEHFFEYIARHHNDDIATLYPAAFKNSKKFVQSSGLPNSFSFDYFKSDKIT